MRKSAHPSACILGKKPLAMHAEEKLAPLPSIEVEYCNGYWDRMRSIGPQYTFRFGVSALDFDSSFECKMEMNLQMK